MRKVWEWVKGNWQWVLFPVGIASLILGRFLLREQTDDITFGTDDKKAVKTLDYVIKAGADKEQAIKHLEAEHENKLNRMSKDQIAQYIQLRKGPPLAVAEWIDRL